MQETVFGFVQDTWDNYTALAERPLGTVTNRPNSTGYPLDDGGGWGHRSKPLSRESTNLFGRYDGLEDRYLNEKKFHPELYRKHGGGITTQ